MHYVLRVTGVFLLSSWLGTLYLTCVPYYCEWHFLALGLSDVFLYQDDGEFLSIHASFSLSKVSSKTKSDTKLRESLRIKNPFPNSIQV